MPPCPARPAGGTGCRRLDDYQHDAWGVDVAVSGSQKGLMLPPGISFNALSPKAIEVSKTARLPKAFWAWDEIIELNKTGYFPYTPSTNLLYGLNEACDMLLAHGLEAVFARHQRWGAGVRSAVRAWGLEIQCADPAVYSPVLTGVLMPEGVDADAVRKIIYERFDCSLGTGLGKVKGRMFRIGHLGDCNDLIPICIRKENKARSRRQCCSTARRSNAVIVFNANWNDADGRTVRVRDGLEAGGCSPGRVRCVGSDGLFFKSSGACV